MRLNALALSIGSPPGRHVVTLFTGESPRPCSEDLESITGRGWNESLAHT
jgi:hypothetical protein